MIDKFTKLHQAGQGVRVLAPSAFATLRLDCHVNISLQVPDQLGGERFPDALESDNTVTRMPDKALPKEKAT